MIVEFDKSFFKSLSNVSDKKIKLKIKIAILEFEKASNLAEVSNCKKTSWIFYILSKTN